MRNSLELLFYFLMANKPLYTTIYSLRFMGEARHNILVKFEQQQKMIAYFNNGQVFDTVNILQFSEDLTEGLSGIIRK